MTVRLKTDIKNLKKKDKPILIATFFDNQQPDLASAGELLYKLLKENNKKKGSDDNE